MSDTMNHGRAFEVLTAVPVHKQRRPRQWSDDEKAATLKEAMLPGANVSAVARAYGLDPSQLHGWRRVALGSGALRRREKAGEEKATFARVEAVETDLVEIWVGDAALRVNATINPKLLAGIVKAVRSA